MGGSYQTQEASVPGAAQGLWGQIGGAAQKAIDNGLPQGNAQTGTNNPWISMYNGPSTQSYGGQLTAPMSGQQTQGLQGLQNWAMNPSDLTKSSNTVLQNQLNGSMLNPATNPYLQQTAQAMGQNMNKAINQNSQSLGDAFSKMGVTYRGPAEQQMRQTALQDYGNNLNNLYGNAYTQGIQNQLGAVNQAQSANQQVGNQFQTLMNAGAVPQQIAQAGLTNNYQDWQRMGNGQANAWNNYNSAGNQNWGNALTNQQNAQTQPFQLLMQMLGGMPLSYPQQTYNKGPLDYAGQFASLFSGGK